MIESENERCFFLEFFEISIYYILFIRSVYPQKLFERKKKYEMVVYDCSKLRDYVTKVMNGIKELMDQKEEIEKLIISIQNDKMILENFVFEISSVSGESQQENAKEQLSVKDLQDFFFKLGSTKPRYEKTSEISWKILICIPFNNKNENLKIDKNNFEWIETDEPHPKRRKDKNNIFKKKKSILPLKTIESLKEKKIINIFLENFKEKKISQNNNNSSHSSIPFETKN